LSVSKYAPQHRFVDSSKQPGEVLLPTNDESDICDIAFVSRSAMSEL
jgi:hypothetical protein